MIAVAIDMALLFLLSLIVHVERHAIPACIPLILDSILAIIACRVDAAFVAESIGDASALMTLM